MSNRDRWDQLLHRVRDALNSLVSLQLSSNGSTIQRVFGENDEEAVSLLRALDAIFSDGLQHESYWSLVEPLGSRFRELMKPIEFLKSRELESSRVKCIIFLKLSLNARRLAVYFPSLLSDSFLLRLSYDANALIRDRDSVSVLAGLLLTLENVHFRLNTRSGDLDSPSSVLSSRSGSVTGQRDSETKSRNKQSLAVELSSSSVLQSSYPSLSPRKSVPATSSHESFQNEEQQPYPPVSVSSNFERTRSIDDHHPVCSTESMLPDSEKIVRSSSVEISASSSNRIGKSKNYHSSASPSLQSETSNSEIAHAPPPLSISVGQSSTPHILVSTEGSHQMFVEPHKFVSSYGSPVDTKFSAELLDDIRVTQSSSQHMSKNVAPVSTSLSLSIASTSSHLEDHEKKHSSSTAQKKPKRRVVMDISDNLFDQSEKTRRQGKGIRNRSSREQSVRENIPVMPHVETIITSSDHGKPVLACEEKPNISSKTVGLENNHVEYSCNGSHVQIPIQVNQSSSTCAIANQKDSTDNPTYSDEHLLTSDVQDCVSGSNHSSVLQSKCMLGPSKDILSNQSESQSSEDAVSSRTFADSSTCTSEDAMSETLTFDGSNLFPMQAFSVFGKLIHFTDRLVRRLFPSDLFGEESRSLGQSTSIASYSEAEQLGIEDIYVLLERSACLSDRIANLEQRLSFPVLSPCSEQSSHTRSRVYPRSSAIGKNLQSERQVRRAVVDSCDIGGDRRLERLVALEERLQREKQAFEWRKRDEEQQLFSYRQRLEEEEEELIMLKRKWDRKMDAIKGVPSASTSSSGPSAPAPPSGIREKSTKFPHSTKSVNSASSSAVSSQHRPPLSQYRVSHSSESFGSSPAADISRSSFQTLPSEHLSKTEEETLDAETNDIDSNTNSGPMLDLSDDESTLNSDISPEDSLNIYDSTKEKPDWTVVDTPCIPTIIPDIPLEIRLTVTPVYRNSYMASSIHFQDFSDLDRYELWEEQSRSCAICGSSIKKPNSLIRPPRMCFYWGVLCCRSCHVKDMSCLPSKILRNWDFTKYRCCRAAYDFLQSILAVPEICIFAVNPTLFNITPDLRRVQIMRGEIRRFFDLSPSESILAIRGSNLEYEEHWWNDVDKYSLKDLIRVQEGWLVPHLTEILLILRIRLSASKKNSTSHPLADHSHNS